MHHRTKLTAVRLGMTWGAALVLLALAVAATAAPAKPAVPPAFGFTHPRPAAKPPVTPTPARFRLTKATPRPQ